MDKAYNPTTWENRPSTASPLDEINLNKISSGLSIVDDRVIALHATVQNSVKSVTVNETTGQIVVTLNGDTSYSYNPVSKVYNTINATQQENLVRFSDIAQNFDDVDTMLSNMDMKIDLTAEGANQGIEQLRTTITTNDGYYRQEMTGIRTSVKDAEDYADGLFQSANQRITTVQSSITQTTDAIQLSVQELSESVDGDVARLRSEINVTSGQIALKVTKLEVIDDLQQEFAGSGISITPERITFASTGSMVVNTTNFKLDEVGNAEFAGHVAMESGSVGGVPIIASPYDSDTTLSIQHSHHAWKLRSAAVSNGDERYYVYITANKNFIVTNSENGGHTEENDRTDDCSIGSYKYPWGKGYFNLLRVKHHDVLPEGLEVTLQGGASNWTEVLSAKGETYYQQIHNVNGMSGDIYLYIATSTEADLENVYTYEIEVDTVETNKVIFVANGVPATDINVVLLVEDFIMSEIEEPIIRASFNQEKNQLTCNWSSPRDSSKFITWLSDELVIERCIDEDHPDDPASWEEVLVVPSSGETPFDPDQWEDTPLIVGSEDESDG